MSARATWQTLQERLTEARNSLELGDESSARRAIDAALALDNFPGALRTEDVGGTVSDPDVPYFPPDGPSSTSGDAALSAEAFAGFEQRALRRRIERCYETASEAIARADSASARDAIAEIRELDADHPSLSGLETQVRAIEASATANGRPAIDEMHVEDVSHLSIKMGEPVLYTSDSSLKSSRVLPLILILLVMAGVGWFIGSAFASRPPVATRSEAPLSQASTPAEPGIPAIARPGVTSGEDRVRRPPTANPEQTRQPAEQTSGTAPSGNGLAASATPASTLAEDEQQIRELLERYRQAYTTLDVRAVQQIWPGGNEADLTRRFDELQSQELVFDTCRVNVHEATATAICRGVVRYVPKNVRDLRVDAHGWGFALRKSGGEWQIESAREGD